MFLGRLLFPLLAILAGLAAFYYFYEVKGREAKEWERRVLAFEEERVEEIVVAKKGDRAVVRRQGQHWQLVEPVQALGDPKAVEGLLYYLRHLRKERELGREAGALTEFGLDNPFASLSLKLRGRPGRLTLHLGERSRLGEWVYARYEGAPTVFLAPARLREELGKTPYAYELRDKTLLAFDETNVTALELERRDARIRLRRGQAVGWEILEPFHGQADRGIVEDLLWKVRHTKVVQFLDDERRDPAPYGLDRPDVRVRIWEDGRPVSTLSLRETPGMAGAVYALVEPGRAISLAERRLLDDLSLSPDRLRNRLLLAFEPQDVQAVEIRRAGGTILLRREGQAWRIGGPRPEEADEKRAADLLEALRNLRFRSVLSERPGDLPRYGLGAPVELTLRLRDGRVLPTLAVGRREGDTYAAVMAGSPPIYSVDSNLIRKIPTHAGELKKLSPEERLRRTWEETKEFLESLRR